MAEPIDDTPQRRATDLPPDAPWWARWLDTNVREAWRWATVRWSGAVAIAAEVYAANADTLNGYVQHEIPTEWWPHVVAAISIATMIFRVTNLKGAPK